MGPTKREDFSVLDVPVHIHRSFILLIALLYLRAPTDLYLLLSVLIPICLLSTFLHELGHIIIGKARGGSVSHLEMSPLGGLTRLTTPPDDPASETQIYLAGPLVTLLLALLGGLIWTIGYVLGFGLIQWLGMLIGGTNAALLFFNLLPIVPLDGGRILNVWLTQKKGAKEAMQTLAQIGKTFAIITVAIAVLTKFLGLIIIALFFWLAPAFELRKFLLRESLDTLSQPGEEKQAPLDGFSVGPAPYEKEHLLQGPFFQETLTSLKTILDEFKDLRFRRRR
jgi:stage IV sporulation protein FB